MKVTELAVIVIDDVHGLLDDLDNAAFVATQLRRLPFLPTHLDRKFGKWVACLSSDIASCCRPTV